MIRLIVFHVYSLLFVMFALGSRFRAMRKTTQVDPKRGLLRMVKLKDERKDGWPDKFQNKEWSSSAHRLTTLT